MGFQSYNCKHCNHSILHTGSVDPEINAWMADAVLLAEDGSRLMVKGYEGYPGEYPDEFSTGDAVWVHRACWEVAGKPEYDQYDGPSPFSPDQGHFFKEGAHDLIDPRITDEAERERLLSEGRALREERHLNWCAQEVLQWIHEAASEEDFYEPPRFSVYEMPPQGSSRKWRIFDKLGLRETEIFEGSEEEADEHIQKLWADFIESDEGKALIARGKQLLLKAREEALEAFKQKGRFTIGWAPYKGGGDVVKKPGERDWVGGRTAYEVRDDMTYKTLAVMDEPWDRLGVKTYEADPNYTGPFPSAEWAARVDEIRAAQSESRRLAEEEAVRLNAEWAAEGYPWDWDAVTEGLKG